MPLEIKTTIEDRKNDFFFNEGVGFGVFVKRRVQFNIPFFSEFEVKSFLDKLSKINPGCFSISGDNINGFVISEEDVIVSAFGKRVVLFRTWIDADCEQSRLQKKYKRGAKYFVKPVSLSDLVGGNIVFK